MTQQPAMPSRHVCQVKYRKVGLQQGGGHTCCHVVPMLPVGRAQQGVLCQRATPSTPVILLCQPGACQAPHALEKLWRGDGFSQDTGQAIAASPGQIRQLWPWG